VACSPADDLVVTTDTDGLLKLWDVSTGRQLYTIGAHTRGVQQVVFSTDGKLLATAGLEGTAAVWDVVTGKRIALLPHGESRVYAVAFGPDGKRLNWPARGIYATEAWRQSWRGTSMP
jgi:WD40 repeat protein